MKNSWRTLAAVVFYILGVLGWIYFGAWMIWTKPIKGLILAHMAGQLSIGKFLIAIVQGFLYLTFAGAVWCVGYILSNRFKKN